ncbi:IS630 family transposase [Enterobacter asburiae]|uniref:IS630 family transposase n=1 Tax=Scandinavium sp. UTDF21-P1B TaxID=3446379 RepID=UPI00346B3868
MSIIAPIPRGERRLMKKAIHKTRDKNHARRLTAMLMLHRGERVSDVARTLCCARSSVGRWINWFTHSGIEGLKSLPPGRSRRWPFEHICTLLRELIKHSPGDFGYQRSRWSTELLAIKINEITGCALHAGTVRRWLPSAGLVWRRAAPTLCIRDPNKDEKMAAIHKALGECSAEHPVFYEDEVDIHKSRETQRWLKKNPKFRVIYQPVYSPWVNHVERLWQALHDTITRNHQCRSMWQLLKKVRYFMTTTSPFPGGKHGLAKV